nr:10070_t:CDS:2 [Entrophospora candida]
MEFSNEVLAILPDNISIISSEDLNVFRETSKQEGLCKIIDTMGKASAKAQDLKIVITTTNKMKEHLHNLYIMKNPNNTHVVGILKVGVKKLFIVDKVGNQHEIEPLCVLDFYIHESYQRSGYGKQIFEFMLKSEDVSPSKLAYDRPSEKFRSFLKKHYNLINFIPQPNSFVVFDQYGLSDSIKTNSNNYRFDKRPNTRSRMQHNRSMSDCGRIDKNSVVVENERIVGHRYTRSLTSNRHSYISSDYNSDSGGGSNTSKSDKNKFLSVTAAEHSTIPNELYAERKREIINNHKENFKKSLYGNNPISWNNE